MSNGVLLLAIRLAVVLAVVLLLDRLLRRRVGATRALWEAAALVLLLAPVASWRPIGVELAVLPPPAGAPIPPIPGDARGGRPGQGTTSAIEGTGSASREFPLVAVICLLGSCVLVVRRLREERRVSAILERALPVAASAPIAERIGEAAATLGMAVPEVYWSPETRMPFVAGMSAPTVVLPRSAHEWSPREQRTVLLHEFVHLRHRDLRHLLTWDLLVAAYWWHPLVWLARRAARSAVEADCDAVAARHSGRVDDYVEDLVRLARQGMRPARLNAVLSFGARSRLGVRLQRLLNGQPARLRRDRPVLLSGMTALGLAVLLIVPVGRSVPQVPEATSTMNISDGDRDVSSNLAGVQARWSIRGSQRGLFFTGTSIDSTIRAGRVAATDRVLVLREKDGGVDVVELRAGNDLDVDPVMLSDLRRIVPRIDPGVPDGQSPTPAPPAPAPSTATPQGARAAQVGLPALSDDPAERVIQAGWVQDGVRYAVMARGDWALRGESPSAADRRAWLVVYGTRLSDGRSQWIVYRGAGGPASLNNGTGSLEASAIRWGAAVFSSFHALTEQLRG